MKSIGSFFPANDNEQTWMSIGLAAALILSKLRVHKALSDCKEKPDQDSEGGRAETGSERKTDQNNVALGLVG